MSIASAVRSHVLVAVFSLLVFASPQAYADQRFERHGKIIHGAQTGAKAQTKTIPFDGRLRDLAPLDPRADTPSALPLIIHADDEVEVRFALPADVTAAQVAETRLIVSGYYERYGALLAEQAGK